MLVVHQLSEFMFGLCSQMSRAACDMSINLCVWTSRARPAGNLIAIRSANLSVLSVQIRCKVSISLYASKCAYCANNCCGCPLSLHLQRHCSSQTDSHASDRASPGLLTFFSSRQHDRFILTGHCRLHARDHMLHMLLLIYARSILLEKVKTYKVSQQCCGLASLRIFRIHRRLNPSMQRR